MFMESEYEKKFIRAVRQLPSSLNVQGPEIEKERAEYKNWWRLCLELPVVISKDSSFPSRVSLTVFVEPTYPFSDYAVFPEDTSIKGYYHQDSETRKLCLWPNFRIGYGENRLWKIIFSAKAWLDNAAKDTLSHPDEPYEIPDFSSHGIKDFKLPRVLFNETLHSFTEWVKHFSKYGVCELEYIRNENLLFIKKFYSGKDVVFEHKYGTFFSEKQNKLRAIWILLKSEPLEVRRQPCRTWGEIKKCLSNNNISLRSLFIDNYKKITPHIRRFYVICVGFPIKDRNKDLPSEIHWQPFLTPRWDILDKLKPPGFSRGYAPAGILYNHYSKKIEANLFGQNEKIFWAKSTNINYKRFFGRGMLNEKFTKLRIGLVGLGAIGSQIANLLVRQGINELILFDDDTIEPGNLCRHTSDMEGIDLYKTDDDTARLSAISPHLKIKSYKEKLPIAEDGDCWNDFFSCDLLIDCSAAEIVFGWLNDIGKKYNKRIVKIYITYGSKYLCMFGNGKDNSLIDANNVIMELYKEKNHVIPKDFFEPQTEMMIEGIGCWHPTFPARLDRIISLVSYAVQRLDSKMQDGRDDSWAIIVGYQGDETFGQKPIINCFFEGYLS